VSLIERLAEPVSPASKSKMDVWVETRTHHEQEAIRVAAANPAWGHSALLNELREAGAPEISESAFRQWRRKQGLT